MSSSIFVKEMENIPCTFTSDLIVELQKISKQSTFDHIVVEVPFSLSSGKVKQALLKPEINDMEIAPVIYLFDMDVLKNDVQMIPKIVSTQIAEAEIVLANVDSADQEAIASFNSLFKEMNPDARIFVSASGSENRIDDFVDMLID